MAHEDHTPTEMVTRSGDAALGRRRIRLSPNEQPSELREISREGEARSREMKKLANRSVRYTYVTILAGLVLMAGGVVAIGFAPGASNTVTAGVLSGFGSAIAFSARLAVKSQKQSMRHAEEMERLNNNHENDMQYWRIAHAVIQHDDPSARSLIKQLPSPNGGSPDRGK
jgi:hypothetical protein